MTVSMASFLGFVNDRAKREYFESNLSLSFFKVFFSLLMAIIPLRVTLEIIKVLFP